MMMMNAIRKTMKRINRISRKLSLLNSPSLSNTMMMNAIRKTMKRINRISRKLSLLNSPTLSNNINSIPIPHDMLAEILARVASSSAADLCKVKITGKDFNKAGDDKHVYRHVSMEDFQVVPWKPSEAVSSFLKRCEENENPEALYKRGMVEYFSHGNHRGCVLLHRAANLGHTAATYVLGIILLEDHDQSIRDQGMELLSKITLGSKQRSRIIRDCRKKSEKILHQIWINDDSSIHPQEHPMCDCNARYQQRGGWSSSDEECEEIFDCEACKWNHERTRFYKMLKGN